MCQIVGQALSKFEALDCFLFDTRAHVVGVFAAERDNRTLNLLAIYGADRRQDREAALSLTDIPGLQALGIKCGDSAIGHNPLYPLLLTGSLAAFLQTALNPHVAGFSEDAMRASCVQGEYTQQRPSP